ncbi:hypothetical protein [Caloranaerobacter sp. DY30410]|uniref:hypothetical protein n=1 Tax=Caloranaerobacter sp. DY30410 TaxID=3238305 RepID=UPI003CFE6B43
MGFSKIFWGFIFLFDFRLNGVDIIPDFIGFILIYFGLQKLVEKNNNFELAKNLAFPLIFISVFDIYQIQKPGINIITMSGIGLIIGAVFTILSLIMVYRICLGISEMANGRSENELATKSMNRWTLYLINQIIIWFILLTSFVFKNTLTILALTVIIISFVVYILMLMLFKEAGDTLENYNEQ